MDLFMILNIIGTFAFSLSGYIIASKAKFDILGITIVTYITAVGGGVIRDILTNRTPFIFLETYPIIVVFLTIIISIVLKVHNRVKLTNHLLFILTDSIGLVVFAYTGAMVAIDNNFNYGGILALSLITSVGGGITRDLFLGKTPFIFISEFYGTISLIIGTLVWFVYNYYELTNVIIWYILIIGFLIRIIAVVYKWKLPQLIK